jgi:hypothetical protein
MEKSILCQQMGEAIGCYGCFGGGLLGTVTGIVAMVSLGIQDTHLAAAFKQSFLIGTTLGLSACGLVSIFLATAVCFDHGANCGLRGQIRGNGRLARID